MKLALPLIIVLGLVLTGCGTVSNVTPTGGKQVDLRKYDRVLVLDFAETVTGGAKLSKQSRKKAEMDVATKAFPDRIAIELGVKNLFKEVTRVGSPDTNTLVISGTITKYEEGSQMARLFVGMGAGSSYFNATVEFKDGATSELLASQQVDKNSWALGGGIAATQTPETFMEGAAKKLAEDISNARLTGDLSKPPPVQQPVHKGKAP